MANVTFRLNDVGTDIVVRFVADGQPLDLSTMTTATIHFRKPDHTTFDRPATLYNTGSSGQVVYTTAPGDLDQTGIWQIWATVNLAKGPRTTDAAYFVVA